MKTVEDILREIERRIAVSEEERESARKGQFNGIFIHEGGVSRTLKSLRDWIIEQSEDDK